MRLEVSKRTDLALLAIRELAERSCLDGASLAEAIGTTTNFLPQVLSPLVKANWITSARGPNGGYCLNADLDEISVLDVVEAIEGATDTGRCVLRGAPCPTQEQCALHTSWVRARGALLAELSATSLARALALAPDGGG